MVNVARFADSASVIDGVSFLGTTDGQSRYNNFRKYPWEDPSEHLARSPLTYTSSRPSNYLRTQLYLRGWFEKYSTKDDKGAAQ